MEYKGLGDPFKTDLLALYNCDCMELLKQTPDKYYSLCIVDPPYGIGASSMQMGSGKNKQWSKDKEWDSSSPNKEYFDELFRVSKNQIIWGGNYFSLPLTKSWILWDKGIYGDCTFADGELAWTSLNIVLRIAQVRYKGFLGADLNRIHPTQKPVALYKWLLHNYAKPGDKILDTHGGSMSIAIACHQMGYDLTLCELDKDYYNAGIKRVKYETAQEDLFG